MGDGIAVAIIDTTVPTHTPIGVPPRVMVTGSLVDMVGHNVDDDLDAVVGRLCTKVSQILLGTKARRLKSEVVGR